MKTTIGFFFFFLGLGFRVKKKKKMIGNECQLHKPLHQIC